MERNEDVEIVIVGGGICGLATALALHRKSIKSLVLERSDKLRATGAAIIVQANGWRALDQLGVGSILRQTAIPIKGGKFITLNEAESKEIPFGVPHEFRCLKRTDLMEAMANSLPEGTIRTSCQVLSVELDPVTHDQKLLLSNGTILHANVVIGCDGVNTCIANMVGLQRSNFLLFLTCVARGFTNYPNGHQFGSEFVMMVRGHVQLGTIPVTEKLVYWFLTRPKTSQDSIISNNTSLIRQSLMESINGGTTLRHKVAMASPKLCLVPPLESMKGFPTHAMDMIQNCMLNFLHLTDLKYRPPWDLILSHFRKGTITIAGDALHATGPFIAQGGSASIEDAIVLARCLAQKMHSAKNNAIRKRDVEEAFHQYAKERKMRIFWISLHSFLIGKKLDAQSFIMKSIIIALMVILFRDPDWHTRYDCGTL